MKEQDFMDALSGVQQDMLDELAEWQNAKTPVTGGLPEQVISPAQNESPVLHTRRRNTMKQKNKQKAKIFRLSRWNIGIGAAVAAAVVAAVSIGREAASRRTQMQTANAPEVSVAEQISEQDAPSADSMQTPVPVSLAEPFSAGGCVVYHGNDIPLPDGMTVQIIRTAEEGQKYLTGSEEQQKTELDSFLAADWLEMPRETIGEPPHDVLFIGVPANQLPENVIDFAFQNGTVTPSGKLHLDLSVITVPDAVMEQVPERQYADDDCFYHFISIPKGAIPELTGWELAVTEYHSDTVTYPDADAEESGTMEWLYEPGAAKSGRNSTLGMKTITPVPEERPDTVPILYGYMHILDEPCGQADATLKPGAVTGCMNTPGINPADADVIKLTLPLHDASAMAAISDLTVSADGVLTLTLDEYYKDTHDGDSIDLTQDNATLVWYLKVPQCSVPLIKSLSLNRVCNEWIGEGDNRAPSAYYASWKHRVIRLTESVSGAEPDIRALAVSDTAQERLTAEVAAPEVAAVRTQADWQALQERFPNMKLGYDEAVTALFLLVPMQPGESAFTAQSVRIVGDQVYAEITVGQSDADDAYRNTGTAVCRLNIPADEVPEISSALHLQTNTVHADDFNALCSTAPFTDVITAAQ